jgi:hypothetical protein
MWPEASETEALLRRAAQADAGAVGELSYLQAVVTFLAIFPMVAYPRFAPLIFGAVASAGFFATGLKYRLRSLRSG